MNADDQVALLLHERMAASTAHLVARPDAATRAVQGGRRRIRRRRTLLAATAAVLALIVAVPFTPAFDQLKRGVEPARPIPGDHYRRLLEEPGQGDLVGDSRYRQAVLTLWKGRLKGLNDGIGTHPLGSPKLAWAGVTPTGPAALVVQKVRVRKGQGVDAGRASTLIGFIGVDSANKPRLVSYDHWRSGTAGDGIVGWYVDTAFKTLVLRDIETSLGADAPYAGPGAQEAQTFVFTHGASVLSLPGNYRPVDVHIRRYPDDRSAPDVPIAQLITGPGGTAQSQPALGWPQSTLAGGAPCRSTNPAADFAAGLIKNDGPPVVGTPELLATSRIADRDVLIGDVTRNGVIRAYAVLRSSDGTSTVIDGGFYDPDAEPLPILIRLPGQNGWAVLRDGAGFEWRRGSEPWQSQAGSAVLIPPEAKQIRITVNGGLYRINLK